MSERVYATAGATLLLLLAILYVVTCVVIDSDYSAFLPTGTSPTQRAFMGELRDGAASRIVLIELAGGTPGELAGTSRKLLAALTASPGFRYVSNGASGVGQRELAVLLPYRYVLSDAVEAPAHFTPAGLRDALEARLESLRSSAGFLDKPLLANDPTGEMRRLLQRLTPAATPRRENGVWFDAAGRRALLLAETRAAGSDLAGQQAAMDALDAAFASASVVRDGTIEYSSPGAMALASRTRIAADARTLSLVSLALVIAILVLVYRSAPVVLLCVLPAALGLLAGVVAVNAAFGSVHGITLAFGATLLGEAVDYPSYLLTQVRSDASIASVRTRFGGTLRLAVLTTASGALALLASGFPGLAQLGLLTLVGVLVAGAATWWVLPSWIPARWTPALGAGRGLRALSLRTSHGVRFGIVAAACAVLAVLTAGRPWWDDDLATMNPLPASLKERDARLRAAMGAPDVRSMLLVSGLTQDDVLQKTEGLRPVLDGWVGTGAIGGFDLVSDLLPSVATQGRRRAALPTDAELQQNLAAALPGLPFRDDTFAPFLRDVAAARTQPPLTALQYSGSALGLKVESLLRRNGDAWQVVIPLSGVRDATALPALLARDGVTEASVLDLRAEAVAMMAAYRQRAVLSSLAGIVLIGALLVAGLHSARRAARVMLPVLFAVAFTAAVLVAAGVALSVFHFVALLLTLGVGVNYALVLERAAHEEGITMDVWQTLAVVSGTALCTFGVLAWSSAPVLHAIGITVCLGVVLSLLLGALLIEPTAARPA